jgi:WD40 repeat protein
MQTNQAPRRIPPPGSWLSGLLIASCMVVALRHTDADEPSFRTLGKAAQRAVFSPDSKLVASCSDDGFVRVVRISDGHEVASMRIGSQILSDGLEFSPENGTLAISARELLRNGTRTHLLLWKWESNETKTLAEAQHSNCGPAFSKDGKLVAGMVNERLVVWETADVENRRELEAPFNTLALSFVGKGNALAVASREEVLVWDAMTADKKAGWSMPENVDIDHLRFSDFGTRLMTTEHQRGPIRFWDIKTGHIKAILDRPSPGGPRIDLSPDLKSAVVAYEGEVVLWRLDDPPRQVATISTPISSVDISRNGRWLLLAGENLKLCDLREWLTEIEASGADGDKP